MSNLENVNLIEQLFQQFIDNGGEPKVTSFKRHLDQLINADIKPLCGRSGKTATGDDWRSEVKARFSGRGAKWVSVSLEEIAPTLETYGHDVVEYRNWIDKAGYAWIRFAGPRVANGVKSAAFEVRTGGSTIDHPKQLHYIALHDLDDKISQLAATPHAMRLEERASSPVVEEEVEVKEEIFEDAMGDIEALMAMEDEEL
tara:strand:- start:1527 stop:2126 length:600 start_codon:yes stop_codon:yes gene_type:complete